MKFILLNPVQPHDFRLDSFDEIKEAAEEFGCSIVISENMNGHSVAFFIAPSKIALEQMCSAVDLNGTVIEYTSVYDQKVANV